jgi:hypothetical protein
VGTPTVLHPQPALPGGAVGTVAGAACVAGVVGEAVGGAVGGALGDAVDDAVDEVLEVVGEGAPSFTVAPVLGSMCEPSGTQR